MSNVWFIGDIHAGHNGIQKFRHFVKSEEHNRELIEKCWRRVVTKRDIVYVLGDAAFTQEGLDWIATLPGLKYLVRGNHDRLSTEAYLKVFKEVYGIFRYKGYWLTHAPIHPDELRGKVNLHGHVHYQTIIDSRCTIPTVDTRYLNCSVEGLVDDYGRCLISLNEVKKERPIGGR